MAEVQQSSNFSKGICDWANLYYALSGLMQWLLGRFFAHYAKFLEKQSGTFLNERQAFFFFTYYAYNDDTSSDRKNPCSTLPVMTPFLSSAAFEQHPRMTGRGKRDPPPYVRNFISLLIAMLIKYMNGSSVPFRVGHLATPSPRPEFWKITFKLLQGVIQMLFSI